MRRLLLMLLLGVLLGGFSPRAEPSQGDGIPQRVGDSLGPPATEAARSVEEVHRLLTEAGRADIAEKEAAALRERARQMARESAARLRSRTLTGMDRFHLGYLYYLADDLENMAAVFTELLADRSLSEEDRQRLRLYLIEKYCERGDLAAAERERGAISPTAFNAQEVRALASMRMAIAHTRAGHLEDALRVQEQAYQAARESGLIPLTWKAARALAELYLALGKLEQSRALLTQVRDDLRRQIPWSEGETLQMLTRTVSQIESTLAQLDLIGKPAPEIAVVKWVEQEPTTLAQWRGRGVALEFWAAWCPDCRGLIPHLRAWAARYEKEGLKIVAVTRYYGFNGREVGRASKEEEEQFLMRFKALRELPFGTGLDDGQRSFDTYHVTWVPTIILIDRAGIVRFVFTWNENPSLGEWMIQKVLAESASSS